jgi:uncharacterized protein YjdB
MKSKNVKVFLLSVMLTTALTSCLDFWHPLLEEEKDEKSIVSSVTIIPESAFVLKGRALQFGAEVIGSNGPAQTVTWAVLGGGYDTAISENGLLTVADDETATSLTVKATSTADKSKSRNATVTISTTAIAVSEVSLSRTTLSLAVGASETLTETVMPSDAANKVVLWSSSNSAVASVSSTGAVIGMSVGSATITVTTTDGNKTATCAVSVTGGGGGNVAVTGVSLNRSSLSLTVGGSEYLSATVAPSNATNKNVTWSSSNSAVATVSGGTVSAVSAGSATITVTTFDGNKTATCAVSVSSGSSTVDVTGVSLNKSSTSLTIGNSETLSATISPSNATNKNVTWSSGNTTVATVNQSGLVSAVSTGNAVITVTTQDGNRTATCAVTVPPTAVTGVSLNKNSTTILVGSAETLTATVAPSNAANKNVTWSSGNTAVATVSSSGEVRGVSAGSATITVTTQDGNKTAACSVTVSATPEIPTGVSLNKTSASITVGGFETLTATVTPSNATNQNVTWESSNPQVATVTNGVVIGVSAGSAVITVTTVSGNRTAACSVTVTVPAVTFSSVTANGSSTQTTTELTLTFSAAITGLSAADITLSGVSGVSKGSITGSNPYTLPISGFSAGGTLTVAVAKTGFTISGSPKTVTIYYVAPTTAVTFSSVTANGSSTQTTTELTLTFSAAITGLSAADITLSGVSGVSKGSITGSNPYTLPISGFSAGGTLTVAVAKTGFTISGSSKTVTIYYVAPTTAVTLSSVTANGSSTQTTTELTLTFSAAITGLSAADITLSGVTGVSKGSITGSNPYTLPISGFSAGGTLTVAVAKTGFTISGSQKTVTIYYIVPTISPTGVSLNKTTLSLDLGGTETLTATVAPTNATNKTVTWKSSAETVATVSDTGLVTGKTAGTATITVTTVDGGKTATCAVTVNVVTPATLASYLATLPTNTSSLPYNIALKVTSDSDFSTIRTALNGASNKYVNLDITGSTITIIPEKAFEGTSSPYGCVTLLGLNIPNSVTNIGVSAFYGCTNLASITIPKSVTSIGERAFTRCEKLTSIIIDSGNSAYTAENGILYNKNKTTIIAYPTASGSYVIPSNITRIETYAFMSCINLSSVTFPNSVTSIGIGAFSSCTSLTSVTIPNSITSIESGAFINCTSLSSITIPNSITSIESSTFYKCSSLISVTFTATSKVTSIKDYAFYECSNLASVTIPDSVTSIGDYAFQWCNSLASLTIPNSVTSIGGWAFEYCTRLPSLTISNSVTSIGNSAFQNCYSLASVIIPNSITSISAGTFQWCTKLTSVTIPNSVTSIGAAAFQNCSSLPSVTIPDSVTSIGSGAFNFCTSLTSVTFQGTIHSSNFYSGTSFTPFLGDLRAKFYATNSNNGTPGTYTTTSPASSSAVWTKQ